MMPFTVCKIKCYSSLSALANPLGSNYTLIYSVAGNICGFHSSIERITLKSCWKCTLFAFNSCFNNNVD